MTDLGAATAAGVPGRTAGERAGGRDVLRKVVLLSMPRTGSTMITRQLSNHPRVRFVGAIFSIAGWVGEGLNRRWLRNGLGPEWDDLDYRVEHRDELMDHWFRRANAGECFGIKQHLSGPAPVTASIVADPSIGKILLWRDNVLACYASDMAAKMKAGVKKEEGKPTFDPDDFDGYLRRRQMCYDRWRPPLQESGSSWIEIEYKEARTAAGIRRVVDFIGLDPAHLGAQRTAKRGDDGIISRFANPDAVMGFLKAHGLERWTHERSEPEEGRREEMADVAGAVACGAERGDVVVRSGFPAPSVVTPASRSGPATRAVLLAMPRARGSLVARTLSHHPAIHFLGPIFSAGGWASRSLRSAGADGAEDELFAALRAGLGASWEDLDYRIRHHRELMERWFRQVPEGCCAGFFQQLSLAAEVADTAAADPSIAKLLVGRRNMLASYAADQAARSNRGSIRFDPAQFGKFISRRERVYEHWRGRLGDSGQAWLELDYSEVATRPGVAKAVEFLGFDPAELKELPAEAITIDVTKRFDDPDLVMKYLRDNGREGWATEEGPAALQDAGERAGPGGKRARARYSK